MNTALYWIAFAALIFAVLFIIRSVILWYFRIDERTELLREQNQLLKSILEQLKSKG